MPVNAPRPRGYTIVELMVAITIGLLILAGLTTLFANNSRARDELERANQQIENGRYALQLLMDDLHNAGYYAEFNPGTAATPTPGMTAAGIPTAIPDPCAVGLPVLRSNIAVPVQGYDDPGVAGAPACLGGDIASNTDILVIRRASTCATIDAGCDPAVAGDPYFAAAGCTTDYQSGNYFGLDTNTSGFAAQYHKIDCVTAAPVHQYRTHIYFVANNDKPGDGIPTLKRAELGLLGTGLGFNIVPLVEGVQNLQIEYGIDTGNPTTGAPAVYTVNPNTYNGCAGAACVGNWQNVVEVKIHLLAVNTSKTPGWSDNKSYTLGLLNDAGAPLTIAAQNDPYKRHVFESAVRLNNIAGRNSP